MTLRQFHAQEVIVGSNRGDDFTGHHHRPDGHRNTQDAPFGRRQHLALLQLSGGDSAIGLGRRKIVDGGIVGGLELIVAGLRRDAALQQFGGPFHIGLRRRHPRLRALDLCVQSLQLQRDFLIGDQRQHVAGLDRLRFPDPKLRNCSRSAHARINPVATAHGRIDRLVIVDFAQAHLIGSGCWRINSRHCGRIGLDSERWIAGFRHECAKQGESQQANPADNPCRSCPCWFQLVAPVLKVRVMQKSHPPPSPIQHRRGNSNL